MAIDDWRTGKSLAAQPKRLEATRQEIKGAYPGREAWKLTARSLH